MEILGVLADPYGPGGRVPPGRGISAPDVGGILAARELVLGG